jgi:hypothetical protein
VEWNEAPWTPNGSWYVRNEWSPPGFSHRFVEVDGGEPGGACTGGDVPRRLVFEHRLGVRRGRRRRGDGDEGDRRRPTPLPLRTGADAAAPPRRS